MAARYDAIHLIYNPNSTGGQAEVKAERFARRLKRRGLKNVHVTPTDYAGHAEELAYEAAVRNKTPLIISISGDGGYNEVINGVMTAKNEGKAGTPVCSILAAGNANDHRRTVRKQPLLRAVLHSEPEAVDILRLETFGTKDKLVRYAHSYIGFGFGSQFCVELNRNQLNFWKETGIFYRTMVTFKPISIILLDGPTIKLDSLVFSNIHQMAKYVRMGARTNLHDGLFRVVAVPHRNRLRLFLTFLSMLVFGFRNPPQTTAYEFKVPETQLVHFDGEVTTVPGGARIRVESAHEALLTIR